MRRGALSLLLLSSSCASAQHPRAAVAELRVIAVPEVAVVEVNERSVGSSRVLSLRPVRLTTGPKRITVRAPGYFPHDLEMNLKAGETKLEITLRPVPR